MIEAQPISFYARPSYVVAPELLGCLIVRQIDDEQVIGRIVETEAYLGQDDAASHAFKGLKPRNRVMFCRAGHAYVYLIYGIHHCLNVVTGHEGEGQAVLIRALEPIQGLAHMRSGRGDRAVRHLCNGPGKLCQAMAIDRVWDGHDLTIGQGLWICPGPVPVEEIRSSPRIGVGGDAQARQANWRYFLSGNPHISPSPHNR